MTPIARFERILKDLDRCEAYTRKGALAHKTLSSKVAAQHVHRAVTEARRGLRVLYYEFEDAVRPLDTEEIDR